DIPNVSKRKRFFASNAGIEYHKRFMGTDEAPKVDFNLLEPEHMDDGLLLGFQTRARMSGFEAYIVPQPPDLPMANRREDMLFVKP
ncbi:MAG: SAM-dependent methyltransferase, partial [Anaerolinea sp.]|nr:SAM-dependent methyltransferase [Anaerolinea sp.]